MLLMGSSLLSAAAAAAAPTITDSIAPSQSSAENPTTFDTTGLTVGAGELPVSFFSLSIGATATGASGSVDDTATTRELSQGTGASLGVYEWTINSSIDATWNSDQGTSERGAAVILSIDGGVYDISDSAGAASTNDPTSPDITTSEDNCLVLSGFGALGGHDLPTVEGATPAGMTFLVASNSADAVPSNTSQATAAVAYEVQASAGATGTKAWTDALGALQDVETATVSYKPA